jgi:hypothetical protein
MYASPGTCVKHVNICPGRDKRKGRRVTRRERRAKDRRETRERRWKKARKARDEGRQIDI